MDLKELELPCPPTLPTHTTHMASTEPSYSGQEGQHNRPGKRKRVYSNCTSTPTACVPCFKVKTKCDGKRPCSRCVRLDRCALCVNRPPRKLGRPRGKRTKVCKSKTNNTNRQYSNSSNSTSSQVSAEESSAAAMNTLNPFTAFVATNQTKTGIEEVLFMDTSEAIRSPSSDGTEVTAFSRGEDLQKFMNSVGHALQPRQFALQDATWCMDTNAFVQQLSTLPLEIDILRYVGCRIPYWNTRTTLFPNKQHFSDLVRLSGARVLARRQAGLGGFTCMNEKVAASVALIRKAYHDAPFGVIIIPMFLSDLTMVYSNNRIAELTGVSEYEMLISIYNNVEDGGFALFPEDERDMLYKLSRESVLHGEDNYTVLHHFVHRTRGNVPCVNSRFFLRDRYGAAVGLICMPQEIKRMPKTEVERAFVTRSWQRQMVKHAAYIRSIFYIPEPVASVTTSQLSSSTCGTTIPQHSGVSPPCVGSITPPLTASSSSGSTSSPCCMPTFPTVPSIRQESNMVLSPRLRAMSPFADLVTDELGIPMTPVQSSIIGMDESE